MPVAPDLTGTALDGRYELHELIGEGAFGRVYRGRDRRLARQVAVKVIKPWWAQDPEWAASFERETQLLASFSDPGIIQIFDVGAAEEGLYYVAELVDGESLAHRLGGGPLPLAQAREVARQLAAALGRAHAQRLVHRDIKPANVLIAGDGRVKVGDFGVARLTSGTSDGPGTVAGTPGYMAPEQARGGLTSPATDVYALGVVLYEMLAGRPPFSGRSAVELALQHVADPPPPLPDGTPTNLAEVVHRAMAKDPADRFLDGSEMAEALALAADAPEAGAEGRSTLVGQPFSPRRNVHPAERRQRLAILALVGLIAAALGGLALALARGNVRVPDLRGMTSARLAATAKRDGFLIAIQQRYSPRPRGTAIVQVPGAGAQIAGGATVTAWVSAGPRPVTVPALTGASVEAARQRLMALRLAPVVKPVPAPGAPAGRVTAQAPAAGGALAPGSAVTVDVAESPRLRPLASYAGDAGLRSPPIRIQGNRWEIAYRMDYQGTCTFIVFCSGPSITVTNLDDHSTVDQFDLGSGSTQQRVLRTGPGSYQVTVSPGSDAARWRIDVKDYY